MNPSTDETTAAVTEWAVAVLPELGDASYSYAADERYKGLPDIAVEIVEYGIGAEIASGALAQLQQVEQVRSKVSNLEVILVVPPDPAEVAEKTLKDFSDRLIDSILKDKTLGNRVTWVSDTPRVSFRPPYVEFEDGTRGRIVTLYLQIAQQVEA